MIGKLKETRRYIEDVHVGEELTELIKLPTALQLFRYSAVTWNSHRIHLEPDYARREGHPDVLVQAHLHGAFLAQMVMDWAGPRARLLKFGWSNRGRAVPGDTLRCVGHVAAKHRLTVDIEFSESNQRSEVCAQGKATVSLPSQGDAD
jgi:hydroxyacyl-ACP dehydratase HTD2-like protein with hotdog domain